MVVGAGAFLGYIASIFLVDKPYRTAVTLLELDVSYFVTGASIGAAIALVLAVIMMSRAITASAGGLSVASSFGEHSYTWDEIERVDFTFQIGSRREISRSVIRIHLTYADESPPEFSVDLMPWSKRRLCRALDGYGVEVKDSLSYRLGYTFIPLVMAIIVLIVHPEILTSLLR